MKNLISDSPTLPTQSMGCTLDHQYIIIDVTPAIILIMEGDTTPDTIAFFQEFMKMPNYSTRDMAIHSTAYLAEAFLKPGPESPFQMGDAQFKAIGEISQIFDAETKIPNRDSPPPPPQIY